MAERFTRAWGQLERGARDGAVHPHVRGDNIHITVPGAKEFGSPPHVRGDNVSRGARVDARGSPHVRGDNSISHKFLYPVHPHVRGDNVHGGPWRRFTPTCVGTTSCQTSGQLRQRFTPTCVGTTLNKSFIHGTRIRKRPSKSSMDRAVFPQLRIRNPCSLSPV